MVKYSYSLLWIHYFVHVLTLDEIVDNACITSLVLIFSGIELALTDRDKSISTGTNCAFMAFKAIAIVIGSQIRKA